MMNKDEKILIVSDLHLTTNFIQRKYNYLEKLFSGVDKIIINGDFWTAYYNTFNEFVKTKWRRLFPILLDKKTVYNYGNHDKKIWQDKRNKQFSFLQVNKYKFETHGTKYLVTHGHTYLSDSISSENFMKIWRFFKFDVIKYFIESLLLRTLGRNIYKPALIMNNRVKPFSKNKSDINYLVIGHTHWAEIDTKNKLINSGIVHSGISNYILITDGTPKLIIENY